MLRTYTNLNADKTAIIDNYFDFDMYIDNVYAVKAFESESAGETYYAETGETLDLISASGAKTDADIDDLIISATKNGAPLAAESPNVTLDSAAADYSFAMRARNRYGVVNQEVTTFKKWTEINAEKAAAGKKLYDLFSDSAESIVTEVYKNGYKIAAEENYVLEDNAWYLITRSSPDYKGVQKAQFTIGTPNATISTQYLPRVRTTINSRAAASIITTRAKPKRARIGRFPKQPIRRTAARKNR